MQLGIYNHVGTSKKPSIRDCIWHINIPPYNPLSMVLSDESSVVRRSDGYFIRQSGWKLHHFNRRIGPGTISVMLRDDRNYLELFSAYYIHKKVITLECKQVFERWDISEIRAFLKRSWIGLNSERIESSNLSNDATEKIKQLANDLLAGRR